MSFVIASIKYVIALPAVVLCIIVLILLINLRTRSIPKSIPPSLPEAIPYVSNTYQYLTNMGRFLNRVTVPLRRNGIIRFTLGFKKVYMVTGAKFTQELFGPPHIVDPNMFHVLLMDKHWGMSKDEIQRFVGDTSGRSKSPNLGTEHIPAKERHWYNHHRIYADYLSNSKYTEILAETFVRFFSEQLDVNSTTEWTTLRLYEYMKLNMAESAIKSMFGTKILELNPELLKAYWEFDEHAGILVWGLPRFLIPRAYEARDTLHRMTRRMTDYAWSNFDWNGAYAKAEWDPYFGSRFSREIAKWLKEAGFSERTQSGHTMATLFGLNGNTLPMATWILMELVQDPQLLEDVRAEVSQAFTIEKATGQYSVNAQNLLSMPLTQSVYTEVLRMHISFNATRETKQDLWVGNYYIKKGSILQSPTQIAHYEEAIWGRKDHAAAQFWAKRHMKYVTTSNDKLSTVIEPRFSLEARPTSFFPFGGGHAMCPGRHFAKREIIMAVAIILVKFDIEFIEWIHADGSASERPAQNDEKYAGAAGMPPDRDMKIRWRRR